MNGFKKGAVALASCAVMAGGAVAGVGEAQAAPRYNSYFPTLISGHQASIGAWTGFLLSKSQTNDADGLGLVRPGMLRVWRANPAFSGCSIAARSADGTMAVAPIWKYEAVVNSPGPAQYQAFWRYFSTKNFRCDNGGGSGGNGGNGDGGSARLQGG